MWKKVQIKDFEQTSEAKFGLAFMNWVDHQLHHAVECRQRRDLTECSCTPFENSFAQLNKKFATGTHSTTKQMMEKTYLGFELDKLFVKKCGITLKLSIKSSRSTDDSLVCLSPNEFAKVVVKENEYVKVKMIKISPYVPKDFPGLPWNLVGVFTFEGLTDTEKVVSERELYGKAVLVEKKVIMTAPRNILREK